MKKNIIYNKNNGIVSGYSDKQIETKEEQVELELTDEEYFKLRGNWKPFYREGKLEFEKPPYVEQAEKELQLEKVKVEVNNAQTTKDLQKALQDLLSII